VVQHEVHYRDFIDVMAKLTEQCHQA